MRESMPGEPRPERDDYKPEELRPPTRFDEMVRLGQAGLEMLRTQPPPLDALEKAVDATAERQRSPEFVAAEHMLGGDQLPVVQGHYRMSLERNHAGTVTVRCPYCRQKHVHGGGEGNKPLAGPTVASCGGGSYEVEIGGAGRG